MYTNKKLWLNGCIILVSLVVNIAIIALAYKYSQIMMGMLIVSLPLLSIWIFKMFCTNSSSRRQSMNKKEGFIQDTRKRIEWLPQLMFPNKIAKSDLYTLIGNEQCSQPFKASVFNIRTRDLADETEAHHNPGLKKKKYSQNSAGIKTAAYRIQHGCVLQVDLNHLFWRNKFGQFNSPMFKDLATRSYIKMIELKLNSSKRQEHDFSLLETVVRPSQRGHSSIFEPAHGIFCHAEGVIQLLDDLRKLSGGKPIGISFADVEKQDLNEACHAIRKTGIIPDFLVVEISNAEISVGHNSSLHDGSNSVFERLLMISNTLEAYSLRKQIKVLAVGTVFNALDVLKLLSLGANVVYTETDDYNVIEYPVKNGKARIYKSQTVDDFYAAVMEDTTRIMKLCGFRSVSDITLPNFFNNIDVLYSKKYKAAGVSILNPVFDKKADVAKGRTSTMRTEQSRSYEASSN